MEYSRECTYTISVTEEELIEFKQMLRDSVSERGLTLNQETYVNRLLNGLPPTEE